MQTLTAVRTASLLADPSRTSERRAGQTALQRLRSTAANSELSIFGIANGAYQLPPRLSAETARWSKA